jgi:acetyl esterase
MDPDRPIIPEELRVLMAAIGPQWKPASHVGLMLEKFSEVHKAGSKEGVRIRPDLAYGSHPRQKFDLYLPEDNNAGRAAVLFVHGGAFVDGDRNRTGEIYANVLHYFGRHGIVGINAGYRLAGDAKYPGATEDIAAAVAWAHEHAREIGADRDRIFLMGHSAGAAHAGSYVYDKRCRPASGPGLAGFMVVSGRVRAENRPENPNAHKVVAYFGTDCAKALDDFSPVSHASSESIPTFVAWSEFENPLIDVHCAELVFRLAQAKGRAPPVVWLPGHNHTSTIAHINTAEDVLGRAMLEFIAAPR